MRVVRARTAVEVGDGLRHAHGERPVDPRLDARGHELVEEVLVSDGPVEVGAEPVDEQPDPCARAALDPGSVIARRSSRG
jgi:hypothetical protein